MWIRLAALLLGMVCAGPAAAGTISVGDDATLVFEAAPGEENDVSIVRPAFDAPFTVVDLGAPLTVSDGCTSVSPNEASCVVPFIFKVVVRLGDLDDEAVVDVCGYFLGRLSGGPGDDSLLSRNGILVLVGGTGADVMAGEAGACTDAWRTDVSYSQRSEPVFASLDGKANDGERGEGDMIGPGIRMVVGGSAGDVLRGRAGRQILRGRGGPDRLIGLGGPDDLQGGDGHDLLRGGSGSDWLGGGRGNDTLLGGRRWDELDGGLGADVLKGDGGDDYLVGGRGRDRAYGGPGRDALNVKDGVPDLAVGGGDVDMAWADRRLDSLLGIEIFCSNPVGC